MFTEMQWRVRVQRGSSWKLKLDSNRSAPSTTVGSKYVLAIPERSWEKQAKMTFQAALKFWQEFNVHDLQVKKLLLYLAVVFLYSS